MRYIYLPEVLKPCRPLRINQELLQKKWQSVPAVANTSTSIKLNVFGKLPPGLCLIPPTGIARAYDARLLHNH
jgi:hypothetical protein